MNARDTWENWPADTAAIFRILWNTGLSTTQVRQHKHTLLWREERQQWFDLISHFLKLVNGVVCSDGDMKTIETWHKLWILYLYCMKTWNDFSNLLVILTVFHVETLSKLVPKSLSYCRSAFLFHKQRTKSEQHWSYQLIRNFQWNYFLLAYTLNLHAWLGEVTDTDDLVFSISTSAGVFTFSTKIKYSIFLC